MCTQCSSVYTTDARYCPRCGGLLRPFSGSVDDARLIREQWEDEAARPGVGMIVLSCLLPGFALRQSFVWYHDERQREWYRIFGLFITAVHIVFLAILAVIVSYLT